MAPHDARLVVAAAATWLAAACAWLGWGWRPVACAMVLGGLGAVRRVARPALALAVVGAIAGACAGLAASRAEAPVVAAVGGVAELTGVAATDAAPGVAGPTHGLWRVELVVTSIGDAPVTARVVVWGAEEWAQIVRGERLVVAGPLEPADGGATAVMWRPTITARDAASGMDAVVADARRLLRDATAGLPQRLRPLVRGMVIGDDSGMPPAQRAQMSAAGLTHLTAVSGSHFAIVLVAVTALLRLMTRGRRIVAVVTAGSMGVLVLLVFPEPSVVRAATMAAAVCAALWWGRPAQALPALSAGVVTVVILDPRLACEPGFVMSACAVAAIALWAPALAARLSGVMPDVVAQPLAVCIAAQFAVLPVLALIGRGVGLSAVLANLAVGWCAAPVTLLGLAALVVAPLSLHGAELLARASAGFAWPVDAAARAVEHLPGASLTSPTGPWGAVACAAVLAVAVALTFATRVRLSGTVLVAAVVVAALSVTVVPRLMMARGPGDWRVVACDVGQGDAMLLRSGPNSAVMIDVGPEGGAGAACLKRYGVRRIDLLVLTHPHADHVGGLGEVLAMVPVGAGWVAPVDAETIDAEFTDAGVAVTAVGAGDSAEMGAVSVQVLAPAGNPVAGDSTEVNDASIVTLVHVDGVTVLGLGDLEHAGQRALAARMAPAVVDVVKVPHHGSDRQEATLAQLVTARLAVVSVGAGNSYGHPAPDALALWGRRAPITARTDLCGDIIITPGPALARSCPMDVAG